MISASSSERAKQEEAEAQAQTKQKAEKDARVLKAQRRISLVDQLRSRTHHSSMKQLRPRHLSAIKDAQEGEDV